MSNVVEHWSDVSDLWMQVSNQVVADDLDKQSSCDEWCVQEVMDHAHEFQLKGANALGANVPEDADFETVRAALLDALRDSADLDGTAEGFGTMPKHGVAQLMVGDLLLHSWDIAHTIGADATLPDRLTLSTLEALKQLPDSMLRAPNMFGPPLPVADDASPQEQLLAFTGRDIEKK